MNWLRVINLLAIMIVLTCCAEAQSPENIFFKANSLYEQGEYEKAISLYQEILTDGLASGALYYNLGNSYYKLGNIGKALVNYERAKKIIPHDEDLFANLTLLNSLVSQKQPEEQYSGIGLLGVSLRDALSADGWLYVLLSIYILFIASLIALIFSPAILKYKKVILTVGFVLLTICAVGTFAKVRHDNKWQKGIVVAKSADVYYSPSYDGALAFSIQEGLRVSVVRKEGAWLHIRLSRGKSGWVDSRMVEVI